MKVFAPNPAFWMQTSLVTCKAFDDSLATTISRILPCLDYCRLRGARVMVVSCVRQSAPSKRPPAMQLLSGAATAAQG